MKIKKTFRLSEDIVELMDHRDQRKYPSREFYLESQMCIRDRYKRSMRSLIWILLIICCNRRNEMDFEKWHDQVKKTMANRLKESWLM